MTNGGSTMRYAIAGLMLAGLLSTLPVVAGATTPAPECRSACAPRIEEQCGGRTGHALRRCRRQLRHSCRATTPDIGCPSTEDLTRALGDRLLPFSADSFIRLCADGSFAEPAPRITRPGRPLPATPDPAPIVSPGPWLVVVDGDTLALDLGAGVARENRLTIARSAAGFVVNGVLTADTDATAACEAAPPSAGSPAPPTSSGGGPVVTLHPRVPPLPQVPQTPELPQR
jgi:hypothetical protein